MAPRSSLFCVLTIATVLPAVLLPAYAQTETASAPTASAAELQGTSTFRNTVEAYIYGYPLVMFGITERAGITVPSANAKLGGAPLNQFGKEPRLPDSSFTAVVLPSTTTLYASSFLNLKTEPVILHIPHMNGRFFILQMLDAWTNVSLQSPGTRLNSHEGDYALVGPDAQSDPDWRTKIPATIPPDRIIPMDTNSMWIIGRIYTDGTDADVEKVKNEIYPDLTLTPLSGYLSGDYKAPENIPLDPSLDTETPPVHQLAGMDACSFFGTMAAMMQYNGALLPQDQAILPKLADVGITKGKTFDCTKVNTAENPHKLAALQLGVAAARTALNALQRPPGPTTNFWTLSRDVGIYGTNYLLRAEVALNALGANNPIDAIYGYGTRDAHGLLVDGANSYKIHFTPHTAQENPGEVPPVNPKAFWSVTIYNADGTLVANNNIHYNAIGVPTVQGHDACFNPDKSLDLYLQANAPSGQIPYCNWLAIPPSGSFIVFLRMYWPDQSAVSGPWIPPGIQRIQ